MAAILRISDGTTEINLLNGEDGFYLDRWRPAIAQWKGGGTFQSSPLSDGRRLVTRQFGNAIETIQLKITEPDQDGVIFDTQELRRLLEKAADYWATDWQSDPVWIEAQATCETNLRYALIQGWSTPDDEDPYNQPFLQAGGSAVMDRWTLIIERGHWLADQPGTGTCTQVSGLSNPISYLKFDETDSEINCGSDAGLDDLHDAAFTVEAWVRRSAAIDDALDRYVAQKGSGWGFYIEAGPAAQGLTGLITCITLSGISRTAQDIVDGLWHHIAMTWDDATFNFPRLWIDGVQATYSFTQNRNGAIVSDAASNFTIGNFATAFVESWLGDIGWMRVSDNVRYTVGFTPPVRCVFPASDANTVAIWIHEGIGTTIDNGEGTAARDGTASDTVWATDCTGAFGRAATCDNEVYVANKRNEAHLTHIFVDDGGVFGSNLIQATTPFAFLPAVPAASDAVYFGIESTALESGPFASLVFDIATAIANVTTIVWTYWNGAAWTALGGLQDNTNADGAGTGVAFDTTGVKSVHWIQPSAWVANAVNGITAFWVRAEVTVIGGGPTGPTQQNRDIYTITWPHIDIAVTQVGGDIPALARIQLENHSGGLLTGQKIVVGQRSLSRGSSFSAYINLADKQNDVGITIAAGGINTAFADSLLTPTGRVVRYSPAGVEGMLLRASITFSGALSTQYYGAYHAYLRVDAGGAAAVDEFEVQLGIFFGGEILTDVLSVSSISTSFIMDFGKIDLAPSFLFLNSEEFANPFINIRASSLDGTPGTLDFVDLILIPVDEFAIDAQALPPTETALLRTQYIDMDSVANSKAYIRTLRKQRSDDQILAVWRTVSNGLFALQANAAQRCWFLAIQLAAPAAQVETAHSALAFRNQRYLSMRGAR